MVNITQFIRTLCATLEHVILKRVLKNSLLKGFCLRHQVIFFLSIIMFMSSESVFAQWGGWENLNGVIQEQPECVSWGPNRIDCFARGGGNHMYHKWWNGSSWGGWENLGGVIKEQPECVSWAPNRIDCFARGGGDQMYHKWWNGSSWGGWENLGGVIKEQPKCVSWGPNRIDCFARGGGNHMYHKWWNGSSWGGWENLGGVIKEQPECVSWGPNRIDCFARGGGNHMYHKWWNGSSWGGWENLGGVIKEQPECVAWGPNRIDCFARGGGNHMYHKWWSGSSWGGWENLGGVIKEQPECVAWGPNRIDCFARGGSNHMYHKWWSGSAWGGWENLGGVIKEQAECVSWGPNRIDCFARGGGDHMYHKWWPCPTCGIPTRSLTVSRHSSISLSNAQVDAIFASAIEVLNTNDGTGDVACPVNLVRSGNVASFSTGDGSLDTSAELSAVFNLPGNIKVVDDVNYCGGAFNTSIIGCGQTPGASFITERFTGSLEGILWAHEYGHNTGLPHRETSTNNVMYPSIGSNRRRVNQTECNSYQGTSGSTAPFSSSAVSAVQQSVKEFVSQIYFDGLPLNKAATYTDKDVDRLLEMLKEESQVQFHENIALTLGMIGSSRSVDPLIEYINNGVGNTKVLSRSAYKGRVGAIVALGYIVNRAGSDNALSFLIKSSSPDIWDSRKIKGLTTKDEYRKRELSKYAIISLGLSGNAKAAEHIKSLNDRTQKRSKNEISFLKDVKSVVDESLQLNQRISRDGLLQYYRKDLQ